MIGVSQKNKRLSYTVLCVTSCVTSRVLKAFIYQTKAAVFEKKKPITWFRSLRSLSCFSEILAIERKDIRLLSILLFVPVANEPKSRHVM